MARTDELTLERDSIHGLKIAWDAGASTHNTVNCMGINGSGAAVTHYSQPVPSSSSAGSAQVFTNVQNVVYATCSFGDAFNARHLTQVTLQRQAGDYFWVGTVISTYNQ